MIMDKLAVEYKLISGNRTCAQQNALYAKGRTKPGPKVTNARCGFSNHNFGLALDGGVFRDGEYLDNHEPKTASKAHRIAGQIFKNHGFEWGGDWTKFKDEPHIQWPSGLSMAEMRRRLKEGIPINA